VVDTDQETVSHAAHQRVQQENSTLKERVIQLENVVRDVGLTEKARDFFKSKGATDPDGLATIALPHLRTVNDPEAISGTLDTLFGKLPLAAATPAPSVEDSGTPAAETAPAEPSAPPANPAPTIAGPNPAAPGEAPSFQKLKSTDPKVKETLAREGWAGVKRMDEAGEIEWSDQTKANVLGR